MEHFFQDLYKPFSEAFFPKYTVYAFKFLFGLLESGMCRHISLPYYTTQHPLLTTPPPTNRAKAVSQSGVAIVAISHPGSEPVHHQKAEEHSSLAHHRGAVRLVSRSLVA